MGLHDGLTWCLKWLVTSGFFFTYRKYLNFIFDCAAETEAGDKV